MLPLNNLEIISIAYLMFCFVFVFFHERKGLQRHLQFCVRKFLVSQISRKTNGIHTHEKIRVEADLMSRRSYGCQESGGVRCRNEFWKMSPKKFSQLIQAMTYTIQQFLNFSLGLGGSTGFCLGCLADLYISRSIITGLI